MSIWLVITFLFLLLVSIALMVYAHYQHSADAASQRRFFELLAKQTQADGGWTQVIQRLSHNRLNVWLNKIEQAETVRLLKQAGWYTPGGRIFFYLAVILVPVIAMLVVLSYMTLTTELNNKSWVALFFAVATGFLLPKIILRRKAKLRCQALSREMPTAVHLLRMLFEAGLSTEHVLRVLHSEGQLLTPELARELKVVLRLIDAGMEPCEALAETTMPLEVSELNDTVAILKQVSRHGGNIRETLVKFAKLMEERQLSSLREYVSVLSGKMSVVMMVFLFPALLIFLAGPGFIALSKGLMGAM